MLPYFLHEHPSSVYSNVIKENGEYYCFEDFFSKYRALKFMLKIKEHERGKGETVKPVKFLQPSK